MYTPRLPIKENQANDVNSHFQGKKATQACIIIHHDLYQQIHVLCRKQTYQHVISVNIMSKQDSVAVSIIHQHFHFLDPLSITHHVYIFSGLHINKDNKKSPKIIIQYQR